MGVEQQFHFPATSEERDSLPFNRNQSPCARISSGSACAKLCKKHSKPPQLDPITACHCGGNLCKNGVDDLLGVLPIQMRVLGRYPLPLPLLIHPIDSSEWLFEAHACSSQAFQGV
jgi:hypothetical protein